MLDLANNELIVRFTDVGDPSDGSSIAGMIAHAHHGGAWDESGITSSNANATDRALGYAEAGHFGFTTFGGLPVSSTDAVVAFTRYGDATLDGQTNISDFSLLASNFNKTQMLWQDGDFNYDGVVDIGDQSLLTTNYNETPDLLRGGPHPLQELYVAMLDYPAVYWESKLSGLVRTV